jgi:hypothetical protein
VSPPASNPGGLGRRLGGRGPGEQGREDGRKGRKCPHSITSSVCRRVILLEPSKCDEDVSITALTGMRLLRPSSLDHLVGAGEERGENCKPERSRG